MCFDKTKALMDLGHLPPRVQFCQGPLIARLYRGPLPLPAHELFGLLNGPIYKRAYWNLSLMIIDIDQ